MKGNQRPKYSPGSSGHVPHSVPKKGSTISWGTKPKGMRCTSGGPNASNGDPNAGKKARR